MIDWEYIEEARNNGIDMLANVNSIENTYMSTITAISRSVAAGNRDASRALCHRISGDLITIGATDASAAIEAVKQLLHSDVAEGTLRHALAEAEVVIRISVQQLRERL